MTESGRYLNSYPSPPSFTPGRRTQPSPMRQGPWMETNSSTVTFSPSSTPTGAIYASGLTRQLAGITEGASGGQ